MSSFDLTFSSFFNVCSYILMSTCNLRNAVKKFDSYV